MTTKMDLAVLSFESVLRHVEHEDNKANRIVISMAFITAAAAAVFSQVVGKPDPIATVAGKDINMTVLMFAVFVAFILGGTLFMLAALGPKFNLPEEWRRKPTDTLEVNSLLFAQLIARVPYEDWKSYWESRNAENLTEIMEGHLVKEAHLLAGKAVYKVEMMSLGRSLYRWALMALAWFLAVSFSGRLELGASVGGFGASLILLQAGVESILEPTGSINDFLSEGWSTPRGRYTIGSFFVGIIGLVISGAFIGLVLLV